VPDILFTSRSRRQEGFSPAAGRSRPRRALRVLAAAMIALGTLALIDAGVTLF